MTMHDQQAAAALAALGNRTRLGLFRLLVRAGDDGLRVGEIQSRLGVPGSTLAHHVQTLVRAGLVVQARNGREIVSRADFGAMTDLVAFLTESCCEGMVDTDDSAVA